MIDPDGRLPILPIIWGFYEIGSLVYDIYNAYDVLSNENSTTGEKASSLTGLAMTIFLPGNWGTAANKVDDVIRYADDAIRYTDDVVDAGKFIDKSGVPQKITKNLRDNMKKATGLDPKDMDAHHMLPKKFNIQFEKAKIDINDPKNGIWLEKKPHYKKSNEYNQKWEEFFKGFEKNNSEPTAEEILTFMKQVMKETFDIDI